MRRTIRVYLGDQTTPWRRRRLLASAALLSAACASLPVAPGPSTAGEVGVNLGDRAPVIVSRPLVRVGEGESTPRPEPFRGAPPVLTRQAVLDAIRQVRDSADGAAQALSKLGGGGRGIGGVNGVFTRYVVHASSQRSWIEGALGGSTVLVDTAAGIRDADMELAVLRLAGPRLEAAMFGTMLLAAWVDFLALADVTLRQYPSYSVERLFVDLSRVQCLIEPTQVALASLDPERVEEAAVAMPALMEALTREYASILGGVRLSVERGGQIMTMVQVFEAVISISALRLSVPRLMPPPGAPVVLGTTLVMGSGGVMMGSQVVVSAEWVEMVRRLVQAGVISLPAVSAAVQIHAGNVMMAQGGGDLPRGVRDALGDGPEVRAMRQTGKAGAGMAEAPKHHVLPEEHRAWFEQRGFKGEMDIDRFCVRLEQAQHQAIHGGGNWRLGRMWADEWSRTVMDALRNAEAGAGRMLAPSEMLDIVAELMNRYKIPVRFVPGRGR